MIVVIGMDPGPRPGLVMLPYTGATLLQVYVVQCTANCLLDILDQWLSGSPSTTEVYFGVERYVHSRGGGGSPGARTRDQVGSAITLAQTHGAHTVQRNASQVKAWATDNRLETAGVLDHVKGMTHARDAARHALFTACHEANIPDPLSRKARRTDA